MDRRTARLASTLALLLALVTACGGNAPSSPASTASATTDAPASLAPPTESAGPSASQAPEARALAEGVISTDDEEYRITVSADGTLAYFARGAAFFPQSREATILETRLVDGEWTEPTVASFSGTYADIDPWLSPDGASLYFSSIRPIDGGERSDAELFRVDRVGDSWSDPVHLATLGSESDELGASVAADGSIWFASDRPGGGGWDLYTAAADGSGFAEPEPIAELNSAVWEFNPAIDADGTTLIFTSIDRDGGRGLGDLFVARRSGEGWSDADPLSLNSAADEYHPTLSVDGATLYFVRRQGDGDLHEIDWSEVAPSD